MNFSHKLSNRITKTKEENGVKINKSVLTMPNTLIEDEEIIDSNNDTYTKNSSWTNIKENTVMETSKTVIEGYTSENAKKVHESYCYGKRIDENCYEADIWKDNPDVDCEIESRTNGEIKETIKYGDDVFSIVHSSNNKNPLFIEVNSNGVEAKIGLTLEEEPTAKITIDNMVYKLIPVIREENVYDSETNDLKNNIILKRDYEEFKHYATHNYEYEKDENERIIKQIDSSKDTTTIKDFKYSIDDDGFDCVEEETTVKYFIMEE